MTKRPKQRALEVCGIPHGALRNPNDCDSCRRITAILAAEQAAREEERAACMSDTCTSCKSWSPAGSNDYYIVTTIEGRRLRLPTQNCILEEL